MRSTSKRRADVKTKTKLRHKLTKRQALWWVGCVTILLLVLTFVGYCFSYQGQFIPRLYVGNVSVGGLTPMQAQAKLTESLASLEKWPVTVDGSAPTEIDVTSLADFDIEAMVIAAQRYSAGDTIWQWFVRRVKGLVVRQQSPVVVSVDNDRLQTGLKSALYEKHDNEAQEVTLNIRKGVVTIKEGKSGMIVDRDAVERALITTIFSLQAEPLTVNKIVFEPEFTAADAALAKQQAERVIASPLILKWDGGEFGADQATLSGWVKATGASPEEERYELAAQAGAAEKARLLLLDIDRDRVSTWLAQISDKIERLPENATVSFSDGSVRLTADGKNGLKLRAPETAAAIATALIRKSNGEAIKDVSAVVESTPPSVTASNIANLGIKELIGRAASDYTGSAENRRFNIALGVRNMNGFILMPGEEWSSLQAIGPVDGEHGFLPEKVILGNKLELQYGGGLCQPVSTLFRAVLDAGLPVTERQNHSRRVSYYEKPSSLKGVRINWDNAYANIGGSLVGYDATVYEPRPDFKFKNDTPGAVLVQASVTNDRVVTFELYGTNDGRQVTINKAQVLYTKAPAESVYEDDPTLPTGTEKQVEKPVPGAKTSFDYTVRYSDGRVETKTYISIYKPVSASYLRGTGPVPAAPAAEATPTQ